VQIVTAEGTINFPMWSIARGDVAL